MTALARRLGACCAVGLFAVGTAALAADIKLSSAWMRPAAAGSDARAYVDIASDAPLTLVGATSAAARKVQLVRLTRYDGTDPGKVVTKMPVEAGTPTRLAYKGSHLRLVRVRSDLLPGQTVPITLQFRDAAGKRVTAQADVLVHGVALPMPQERPATTN